MNQEVGIEASLIGPDDVPANQPRTSGCPRARPWCTSPARATGAPTRWRRASRGGSRSSAATCASPRPSRRSTRTAAGSARVRTPRGEIAAAPRRDRRRALGGAGRAAGGAGPPRHAQPGVDHHAPADLRLEPDPSGHRRPPSTRCTSAPRPGGLILVGNTRDTIDRGDPDRYEDRPSAEHTTEVLTRLARLMPGAATAAITGGWSGMYEVSPDWNPIMGTAVGVAGLHYAVGFSGHGFKLSPVVGILMAEQILDGRARTDRHHALPARAVPGGPGAARRVPGRRRHGIDRASGASFLRTERTEAHMDKVLGPDRAAAAAADQRADDRLGLRPDRARLHDGLRRAPAHQLRPRRPVHAGGDGRRLRAGRDGGHRGRCSLGLAIPLLVGVFIVSMALIAGARRHHRAGGLPPPPRTPRGCRP